MISKTFCDHEWHRYVHCTVFRQTCSHTWLSQIFIKSLAFSQLIPQLTLSRRWRFIQLNRQPCESKHSRVKKKWVVRVSENRSCIPQESNKRYSQTLAGGLHAVDYTNGKPKRFDARRHHQLGLSEWHHPYILGNMCWGGGGGGVID